MMIDLFNFANVNIAEYKGVNLNIVETFLYLKKT